VPATASPNEPPGGGSGGFPPDRGGDPSRSLIDPRERAVRTREEAIRHDAVESLYAFDVDGTAVFTKVGGRHDIALSLFEIARLQNTVLTHNHPSSLSLSLDDVRVAMLGDLFEVRAVTAHWRFILRRPDPGWDFQMFRRQLEPAYRRLEEEVLRELLLAINDGRMTEGEAQASHRHEVWIRLGAELGLQYWREP
jgi:hypothetical protein